MAKLALVLPGQGAQYVGMGQDFAAAYPECAELFTQADQILGYELSRICFGGPAAELTKTNHCQPAIFVASVACYHALRHELPELAMTAAAGLSLGEWTALHLTGALSFADTLKALQARGESMQRACDRSDGAMLSVLGLTVEQLVPICQATGAEMANLNFSQQTVVSGPRPAVTEARAMAKQAGAKLTQLLDVAGAYHSVLMQPAAEQLHAWLQDLQFGACSVPVLANATAQPHGSPDEIKQAMVAQVTSPVLWQKSIEWLKNSGVTEYVECGPGKVLSGLIKRIDRKARIYNVQDRKSLERTVQAL